MTNFNDATVSVLLNQAGAGLRSTAARRSRSATSPTGVAAADFNKDGRPDLAVTNSGNNNVMVLLRNAAGGFRPDPSSPVLVGLAPYGVSAGDFDSDGREDLAVANAAGSTVSILINTSDVIPPQTTISEGPSGPTKDNTPTFAFSSNEAGSTFTCQLDNGPAEACQSPHTLAQLGDGPHELKVVASDASLNVEAAPPARAFTVDTVAPKTTITGGPSGTVATATPTFEFTADEAGVSFSCALDGGGGSGCSSPFTTAQLSDGPHELAVTATDAAGNVEGAPAKRGFRVQAADADGDGAARPFDCNDADPAIRPGAVDVPGDKIDQDCVGGDAAYPLLAATLVLKTATYPGYTKVLKLTVSDLTGGETITLQCRGGGCPAKTKKKKATKVKRAGTVKFSSLFKRARLRPGVKLDVVVTKPRTVGRVLAAVVRRGNSPKTSRRCLPPGARKSIACR